jgi:phospholipid-binding lipoprotein MlaA
MFTTQKNSFSYIALVAGAALMLSACASNEATMASYQNAEALNQISPAVGDAADTGGLKDPLESSNRRVFAFNNAIDHALINPLVKGYRFIVPEPARKGVRNALRNLKSPTTFANQVLQGDMGGAADVLARAVINSTVGILGLFDPADRMGIHYEQEDFGQTLGVWGIGHGPYVVVPILGPSSARDYFGYFVDGYADPLRWYLFNIDKEEIYYAKLGVDYIDLRESLIDVLADLERSSIDYYAAVRSIYAQRREALKNDEMATAVPDFEEFSED